MPYPEQLCAPMRLELTGVGFTELRDAQQVDAAIPNSKGTLLLVMNSVCGCAAGAARPGVKIALQKSEIKPDHLYTVFAGQDLEAVAQARKYTLPYPPSSPCIALFKDGELVSMVERYQIEGRPAQVIAQHLINEFDKHCN